MALTGAVWPVASIDRIERLRLLAEGLPGLVFEEVVVPVPFDRFWTWLSDLERSVPTFEDTVGRIRIAGEREGRLDVRSWVPFRRGIPVRFDVDLAEGWCWMVSRPRAYVVGMVAEPTADGKATRYAHLEGVAVPVPRWLVPISRWVLRRLLGIQRRHVHRDVRGIVREVGRQ